jgi:energy-coupling factor transporter transmembrane protein EcfT
MIIYYIAIGLVLVTIIILIIYKKWRTLLSFLGIILVIVFGSILIIYHFASAIKDKCEIHREWKIDNYYIVEKQCIGFSGPNFFPVYLYKDGKEIDKSFIMDSSCIVQFVNNKKDTLEFDICEKILKK